MAITVNAWPPVGSPPVATEKAAVALQNLDVGDGTIFYVDSGASGAGIAGLSPGDAFATVDQAINLSIAGDVIIALPGHAETISNATSLVPDVAGVSIIAVGVGARRPTITFDNASSEIIISAASVLFSGFRIRTSGTIDVALAITVTGDDCVVEDIDMRELSTTSQIIVGIFLNVALRAKVLNCNFLGLAGDATVTAIRMTGSTGLEIAGNRLVGNFQGSADATGPIQSLTTLNVDIDIHHNRMENRDGTSEAGIVFVATDTGLVWENFIAVPTGDFAQGLINDDAMRQFNNYVVDVAQERGAPIGTASA
jgi:hypothetical protein